MQISNTTQRAIGFALRKIQPNGTGEFLALNRRETRWRVKLGVKDSRGQYGRRGHSFNRDGERRRVAALCWHGFRDFLTELYQHSPYAVVRTARATYEDVNHFHATFSATGNGNIGSWAAPLRYRDACDCE